MSRISFEVTPEEHQKLKALAALQGKSIKDYVIECTLGGEEKQELHAAVKDLEKLLDGRIRSAQKGAIRRRSVGTIFKAAYRETDGK